MKDMEQLEIVPLSEADLYSKWNFDDPAEKYELEAFLEDGTKWHVVLKPNGDPIAVFDIRDTPGNYFKSMRVNFHPSIRLVERVESPEEVERILDIAIYTLGTIFDRLIAGLDEKKTKVKIYNEDHILLSIFVGFAKHLESIDKCYKAKKYRNWIEVTKD